MELFRDLADQFERHTGSSWRPRSGSMANHRTLTAVMIDSRDFLAAKRRAETEVLLPVGPKIAFTGGLDFNDHSSIWAALDKVRGKHPDMVLLHGGSPKGAERIAACWADNRNVTQVVFKPDWNRHARAAPFKRNDRILEVLPIRCDRIPRLGHLCEPRRQGEEDWHPGLELWRRVSTAVLCNSADRYDQPRMLNDAAQSQGRRRSKACCHSAANVDRRDRVRQTYQVVDSKHSGDRL